MIQQSISGLRYTSNSLQQRLISWTACFQFVYWISSQSNVRRRTQRNRTKIRPLVPRTESHSFDQGPKNKNFSAIEAIEIEKLHPILFHEISLHFKFTKTRGTDVWNPDT